jgi:hypothetical protein
MYTKRLKISELPCLGPASVKMLAVIGIHYHEDLEQAGPVQAFLELEHVLERKPSLNLLYAMKLALENRPWSSLTTRDRAELVMEIEACHEYRQQCEI